MQWSYAIGVPKPLSLLEVTYGTEQSDLAADDITNVVKIAFDCSPGAVAQSLARETVAVKDHEVLHSQEASQPHALDRDSGLVYVLDSL